MSAETKLKTYFLTIPNCAKWLLKIAEKKKVVINLLYLMDFGSDEFKIRVLNTGKIMRNMGDFVFEAGDFM